LRRRLAARSHGIYLIAITLSLFFAPGALRLVFAFPAEFDWWNLILARGGGDGDVAHCATARPRHRRYRHCFRSADGLGDFVGD
jgi:hypothetical protein